MCHVHRSRLVAFLTSLAVVVRVVNIWLQVKVFDVHSGVLCDNVLDKFTGCWYDLVASAAIVLVIGGIFNCLFGA